MISAGTSNSSVVFQCLCAPALVTETPRFPSTGSYRFQTSPSFTWIDYSSKADKQTISQPGSLVPALQILVSHEVNGPMDGVGVDQ